MAVLSIKSFGGIAPVTPPRYLQDSQAQIALNCPVFRGSIQPLTDVGASVATLTKTGTPKSIYRFGQDTVSDNNYWLHWLQDVDVCRSQISGDVSEWTFFTGDGGPKATYNSLALSGSSYPTATRPLGLPAPAAACAASADTFTAVTHEAEILLSETQVGQLSTTHGILISTTTDDADQYTTVALAGTITVDSVAAAIEAKTALDSTVVAIVSGGLVKITSAATGATAKLFVKYQTGTTTDTDGTFTLLSDFSPALSATGTADTDAYVVIEDSEIGSIAASDKILVSTQNGTVDALGVPIETAHINFTAFDGTLTATGLAAWLNNLLSDKVTATVYGSCVVLTPDTVGGGSNGTIIYRRRVGSTDVTEIEASGSESAAPATLFVTQSNIDVLEGNYLKLTVNGTETILPINDPAYVAALRTLSGYGLTVETFGVVEPFAVVTTNAVGTSASLSLRGGTYPSVATFAKQSGQGYVDEDSTLETRVYTYTWVNKEAGFEFESAPASASGSVDVRDAQTVSLSGFATTPGGEYIVTHKRVYRAVSGVYLFIKEIAASETTFVDDVKPDELGEVLPTVAWAEPPQTLSGLTNLPNGLMAGFSGRDIYFCDPYHPHAWPEAYIQTIDFPVVGLARMDTTLAVLTKGCPYLIQGTHPETMAVVKSDLEQACVSKRSIVNVMGAVVYASPDGLMVLSPGGSKIVTENLFNYTKWQAHFKPESIHAYQHDNQYIAFYDNGTTQGGFIFDIASGQFILHDIYATAGYQDIQRDKLFLAFSDRTIKPWGYGSAKSYIWKSKKFTMPQVMGFSCAQLEAEAYPMTVKVYSDTVLVHTQTVQNRNPFRLPAKVGRDWEMQVEGVHEVFSLSIANSMTELASG
jgi:hypothetical protein|tara:strand:- start:2550 stop:5159 length:2610 start_codon:yes stop_codon:yes gene_type:complete